MNDDHVIAIVAAIIGHGDLQSRGKLEGKEEYIRLHVETARGILAEATKHTRGFGPE